MRSAIAAVVLSGVGLAAAMVAASPFPHRPASILFQQGTPADTGRPAITLLYQNFPNPFPTPASKFTCIWFDLNRTASVSLTVHDVRGNLVRRLLPNASSPQFLQPGRYGRGASGAGSGCDPALTWDGTDADGKIVPRGVYLIRLQAGGARSIKKAVFQGP